MPVDMQQNMSFDNASGAQNRRLTLDIGPGIGSLVLAVRYKIAAAGVATAKAEYVANFGAWQQMVKEMEMLWDPKARYRKDMGSNQYRATPVDIPGHLTHIQAMLLDGEDKIDTLAMDAKVAGDIDLTGADYNHVYYKIDADIVGQMLNSAPQFSLTIDPTQVFDTITAFECQVDFLNEPGPAWTEVLESQTLPSQANSNTFVLPGPNDVPYSMLLINERTTGRPADASNAGNIKRIVSPSYTTERPDAIIPQYAQWTEEDTAVYPQPDTTAFAADALRAVDGTLLYQIRYAVFAPRDGLNLQLEAHTAPNVSGAGRVIMGLKRVTPTTGA